MPLSIESYLPNHLKHLRESVLYKSLDQSVSYFLENRIVDERFVGKLVEILATEFERACDRVPINSKMLEIAEGSSIVNYRYHKGYWEIVVPGTSAMVSDHTTGSTSMFQSSVDVAIEGSGGPLRKGKRKSESIKRAHTRQVAKDIRWDGSSDESEDEYESDAEEEDDDWKPQK
jgi:hypothetical protein